MKTCSKCGESKPLEAFDSQKGGRDGLRARCKPCRNEDARGWYKRSPARKEYNERNREKRRKYHARWYRQHEAEVRSRMMSRYWNDPEARRIEARAYYEANKDRAREYYHGYYEANKPAFFARAAARRALVRGADAERIDYALILERDKGLCGICGQPVDPENWHLDHIVPLAHGGPHCHDNVQVAHPWCNLSKGATLPEEVV